MHPNLSFLVLLLFSLCSAAISKVCTNHNYEISKPLRNAAASPDGGRAAAVNVSSLDEFNWEKMKQKLGRFQVPIDYLKEMPLHAVRLDPKGLHGEAQQMTLEYLLMLDVDRLVWSFRKTAGLPTPGHPYGGWEEPNGNLRGHFVGHYLSATALMWASTKKESVKWKMFEVVEALSACQEKLGTGYLSAFPSKQFDDVEALKYCWAPYYTIHKIMSGLLDQHTIGGNPKALKMLNWMVDYFYKRVEKVISQHSIERHYQMINEEHGGMNELLYRLYNITRNPKHFLLGRLFDKPCFLGALALEEDELSGYHANTHIPIVIGAQVRHEITGDPLYQSIGSYFMDIVNSSHSYATGGITAREFWTDPKRLATTLETDNEETCTTYNMLKVSRHLFRSSKEMAYADYYERALTNGILGIQKGPGMYIYFLPLGRGVSKAISQWGWGTPFRAFWCCYGTAIETFAKLGDSIYFEDVRGTNPTLYIIQLISSFLEWKSANTKFHQRVRSVSSWHPNLRVEIVFPKERTANEATLNIRVPFWSLSGGVKAYINAEKLPSPIPGSFLSVTRKWNSGDKLSLELPLTLRLEHIEDDRSEYASVKAIFFGPYLLAGLSNGDWDINIGKATSLSDWITPIPPTYNSHLVTFSQSIGGSTFTLAKSAQSIRMVNYTQQPGTNTSVNATFRLIINDPDFKGFSSLKDVIGKTVVLEPFDLPGKALAHQGENKNLVVKNVASNNGYSTFIVVAGLDGMENTISLEANSKKGCFVNSDFVSSAAKNIAKCDSSNSCPNVKLTCKHSSNESIKATASFLLTKGISEYHPISFVAKGAARSFLLQPIVSLRDEHYSVYFNIVP